MTVLEMKMGAAPQQTSNPVDQASHAASPENHNLAKEAEHMVFVVAAIMLTIYGLKVVGRVLKRAEK